MAITPSPGYQIDPNNPNGVIPIPGYQAFANPNANFFQSGGSNPIPSQPMQSSQTPQILPELGAGQDTRVFDPTASGTGQNATTQNQDTSRQTSNISPPTVGNLRPGQHGANVQALQDYLVQMGYLTSQQVSTGPGIYGPQTTAAVAKLQKDLGVNNAGGIGFYGPKTQAALKTKYNEALQNLNKTGQNAPNTNDRSQISSALASTETQSSDPVFSSMAASMAPIMQSLGQVLNNINNPALTAVSLQQEYNGLQQQYGLPDMQAHLLNMQNVMNGTEQDIRDEISKSGGFATDSQVMALAASRNKTILKQYNALSTQYQAAVSNVQNMMQYATTDQQTQLQRQQLTASVTENMASIYGQMFNMSQTLRSNAIDASKSIIQQGGFQALAATTGGNPELLGHYENLYGMAPGTLSNPEAMKWLGSNPDTISAMVAYTKATGNIPPFGMNNQQMRNQFWMSLGKATGNDMSTLAGQKASISAITAALRTQEQLNAGNQTAISTMTKQGNLIRSIIGKLPSDAFRSGSPFINEWTNFLQKGTTSNPAITNLDNALQEYSYEFARILGGQSATVAGTRVSTAEDSKAMLNSSMSNSTLLSVLDQMDQTAGFRIQSGQDTVSQLQSDFKSANNGTLGLGSPVVNTDQSGGFNVSAPDGKTYYFKDKKSAQSFSNEIGNQSDANPISPQNATW